MKTCLAPGSRVVTDYLEKAGLLDDLAQLGFYLVGYGCTTCIGNSGPLKPEIPQAHQGRRHHRCSVLSGNRNFDGRVHPEVKMNYLASPPLVVAYALAGTLDIDLDQRPARHRHDGQPVYLRDIWPTPAEIADTMQRNHQLRHVPPSYGNVFTATSAGSASRCRLARSMHWDSSPPTSRIRPTSTA